MLEYDPILHVSYCTQNYVGIIRQGLFIREWLQQSIQIYINTIIFKPVIYSVIATSPTEHTYPTAIGAQPE